MNLRPAPGFFHAIAMKPIRRKVGKIEVVEDEASIPMGRVVGSNKTEKFPEVETGDLIMFPAANNFAIRQTEAGAHLMVHQDAVLCSCKRDEFEGELAVCIIAQPGAEPPGILRVDGTGATVRMPARR